MRRSMSVIETMPTGRRAASTTTTRPLGRNAGRASSSITGVCGLTSKAGSRHATSATRRRARPPAAPGVRRRWSARRAPVVGPDDWKGAEELSREPNHHGLAERQVRGQRHGRCRHDGGNDAPGQLALDRGALRLGRRGDDDEAADQRQPEAADWLRTRRTRCRVRRAQTRTPGRSSRPVPWPARDPQGAARAARGRPGRRRAGRWAGG